MTDKHKSVQPKSDKSFGRQNDDLNLDQSGKVIQDLTDALQRERADSVNLRRQHEAALSSASRLNMARFVKELLPAMDSLERSLKHVPDELKNNDYALGVQAVVKQFTKVFDNLGIERIKTVGQQFDPKYHEAVNYDDSGKGSQEVVSEELQSGYKIGDEVIRPAMVNVRLADK